MPSPRTCTLTRSRHRRAPFTILGAGVLALALTACVGDEQARPVDDQRTQRARVGDGPPAVPVPASEFVLSAGDSTFWIRTGADGISMRSSPLMLARADDRYFELYVTDQDQSVADAVFIGQQLWRRDLVTNDSALVFSDSSIFDLARSWRRGTLRGQEPHPDDYRFGEPLASASGELAVLDVVGPFVSYEWFSDVHPPGGPPTHRLHRGVLDVRTGRRVPLATLVGDSAARSLERRGELLLDATADSLVEDGIRAADFVFDPSSFSLGVANGAPVIAFLAPARAGAPGEAGGLPLSGLPARPLAWWDRVRSERAAAPEDGEQLERWELGENLHLIAKRELEGDVALLLRMTSGNAGIVMDSAALEGTGEWVIGHVSPPVQRIYGLSRPPLREDVREALIRAFDDATRYQSPVPAAPLPPRRLAVHGTSTAPLPPTGPY